MCETVYLYSAMQKDDQRPKIVCGFGYDCTDKDLKAMDLQDAFMRILGIPPVCLDISLHLPRPQGLTALQEQEAQLQRNFVAKLNRLVYFVKAAPLSNLANGAPSGGINKTTTVSKTIVSDGYIVSGHRYTAQQLFSLLPFPNNSGRSNVVVWVSDRNDETILRNARASSTSYRLFANRGIRSSSNDDIHDFISMSVWRAARIVAGHSLDTIGTMDSGHWFCVEPLRPLLPALSPIPVTSSSRNPSDIPSPLTTSVLVTSKFVHGPSRVQVSPLLDVPLQRSQPLSTAHASVHNVTDASTASSVTTVTRERLLATSTIASSANDSHVLVQNFGTRSKPLVTGNALDGVAASSVLPTMSVSHGSSVSQGHIQSLRKTPADAPPPTGPTPNAVSVANTATQNRMHVVVRPKPSSSSASAGSVGLTFLDNILKLNPSANTSNANVTTATTSAATSTADTTAAASTTTSVNISDVPRDVTQSKDKLQTTSVLSQDTRAWQLLNANENAKLDVALPKAGASAANGTVAHLGLYPRRVTVKRALDSPAADNDGFGECDFDDVNLRPVVFKKRKTLQARPSVSLSLSFGQ